MNLLVKCWEKITLHEGDTVEIITADDGALIGKRGLIVYIWHPGSNREPYFAVQIFGTTSEKNKYWTAQYLKLIETYEQATAREIGDEYFA